MKEQGDNRFEVRVLPLPRFSGIATFMRLPLVQDLSKTDLDIALVGIPFDGAVENRAGARHGPRQIREMSCLLRSIHPVTRISPYEICSIADVGDVATNCFDIEADHREITRFFQELKQQGIIPLAAGGDHSITLPVFRALARDGPVGMVHVDAHTDTCDEEMGFRYTHGTPFRRAVEEGLLDPGRTVQIGIRGAQDSEEGWNYSRDSGMRVIFMEEFTETGVQSVIAEARRVVGSGPAYISFDVDGLDPVYCPGTGTPEIGGITTIEAQQLLRGLRGLDLIGGDVVEVAPPFDPSGNTALVAATMMYEILCLLADSVVQRKV